MEKFLKTWDHLESQCTSLDDKMREGLFLDKIEGNAQELAEDLARYRRQTDGHPDRSYTYLRSSMLRCILRKQERMNDKVITREIDNLAKGRESVATPAPKAKGDGKVKKSKKDKGRGRGGGKGGRSRSREPSQERDKSKIPCRFHLKNACAKGKDCEYSHSKTASKGDGRKGRGKSQNRGGSANPSGRKGGGKGKKPRSQTPDRKVPYTPNVGQCFEYQNTGKCSVEGCKKPHLTVREIVTNAKAEGVEVSAEAQKYAHAA